MEIFRLSRKIFGETLSGKCAAIKGGRWNSAGVEMIYAASNRSLAMAEVAVHFSLATLPSDFQMLTIHAPDSTSLQRMHVGELPPNWNVFPPIPATQAIGDQFVREASTCLLFVPSAVTQDDYNVLINPAHPEASAIRVVAAAPFPFDRRLFENRGE